MTPASCTFNAELYDPCAVYANPTNPRRPVHRPDPGGEVRARERLPGAGHGHRQVLRRGADRHQLGGRHVRGGYAIKLDPAGRITLCLASETDPVIWAWKTIDAPLENLGLYRAVMTNGCFGAVTEEKVGEEGARVVVTTALDPTGIFYLMTSGLDHLVCSYTNPSYTMPASLQEARLPGGRVHGRPRIPSAEPRMRPARGSRRSRPIGRRPAYTPGDGVTREDMLSAAVFIAACCRQGEPDHSRRSRQRQQLPGREPVDLHHGQEGQDPDHQLLHFQGHGERVAGSPTTRGRTRASRERTPRF